MKNYEYGMIGNCTSGALISTDASIDWLCLPAFDSPSVFGKLLDENKGGFFKIEPINNIFIKQVYIKHTAVLRTEFTTEDGTFRIDDYMPRYHTARNDYYCPGEIVRMVRVVDGHPKIRVKIQAAPNYALGGADSCVRDDYIKYKSQAGEYDSFYLYTDLDKEAVNNGAEITLSDEHYFIFTYHEKIVQPKFEKIYLDYQKTKTYWMDWVQRTKYKGNYREEVIRSAITLKLLSYQKSGAVIAALTTSLPEIIGRDRNWDYRFCWVRDAAMMIDLYARLGHINSSTRFMNFILNRMPRKHESIRVMYGINGEKELVEKELDHLAGYMDSKPVRIGNGAYTQQQNDLYGELIETLYTYFVVNKRGTEQLNAEIWTLVRSLVKEAEHVWKTKDSGIWERRDDFRHYTHSKLMNWVAFDRAAKIAKWIGKEKYVEEWNKVADEIKEDIIANAWNDEIKAFTMYYGADTCDAANLLMLHYGFLPNDDSKIVSTVKVSYDQLVEDNFCFRYIEVDEFGKPENAFVVCTFWMINALYLIGEEDKAREMFENMRQHENHVGLLAEDVELATGRLIGNFPQGYSHLAFIQSVLLLETKYDWSDAVSNLNKF